jgi:hypothetical protein
MVWRERLSEDTWFAMVRGLFSFPVEERGCWRRLVLNLNRSAALPLQA